MCQDRLVRRRQGDINGPADRRTRECREIELRARDRNDNLNAPLDASTDDWLASAVDECLFQSALVNRVNEYRNEGALDWTAGLSASCCFGAIEHNAEGATI